MSYVEHYSDFKWIKVKRYEVTPEESWEKKYETLAAHHNVETNFLITEIRKLAEKLDDVDSKKKVSSSIPQGIWPSSRDFIRPKRVAVQTELLEEFRVTLWKLMEDQREILELGASVSIPLPEDLESHLVTELLISQGFQVTLVNSGSTPILLIKTKVLL